MDTKLFNQSPNHRNNRNNQGNSTAQKIATGVAGVAVGTGAALAVDHFTDRAEDPATDENNVQENPEEAQKATVKDAAAENTHAAAAKPSTSGAHHAPRPADNSGHGKHPENKPGEDNPGGNKPGEDNPGGNHPGGDNPGGDNPGGNNPGGNNPGGDNPGGDNPGGNNPGGDNPGGDNPGGDNPGGDNPGEITTIDGPTPNDPIDPYAPVNPDVNVPDIAQVEIDSQDFDGTPMLNFDDVTTVYGVDGTEINMAHAVAATGEEFVTVDIDSDGIFDGIVAGDEIAYVDGIGSMGDAEVDIDPDGGYIAASTDEPEISDEFESDIFEA